MSKHCLLISIVVTVLSFSCDSRRQLRTFTDLQLIARWVELQTAEGQRVTSEAVANVVRTGGVNQDGHDVWGNEIIYSVRGDDWVLISPGADRELDFESMNQYFLMETEDIHGQPERDIVFRNGKHVTYAGK